MSKTITPEVATDEAAAYEEAVAQMLAQMQQANEKMGQDQEEIDRLRTETREILARLKAA
jgi:phosphoglycolate phosphatase-like HAD superfamily hydrolase